jgi:hypothetical protein
MDAYDRGARLAPAYLVFSPAVVLVVALSLGTPAWWSKLGGVLVACGAPILVVQWGREGGRKRQSSLFERWGGSPSTSLLRFRTGGNAEVVAQRHDLVEVSTGIDLPSQSEESADPDRADAIYDAAVATLRELTRDEKQFPLLLKENIQYGFRRNLWGRKIYGIAVAGIVALVSTVLLIADAFGDNVVSWMSAALSAGFAVAALVLWTVMVTEEWVHRAAEYYAIRLLESAVRLPQHER